MARIIIGADVVPTTRNIELFEKGDIETLIGKELKDILDKADFRVVNLEVPLTDELDKLEKSGPNLSAPTKTIAGYKALGVDLVTGANNHILDQKKVGFDSTVKVLKENGIPSVGIGYTYEEAYAPKIFEIGGKKIGFYATCQHEFSWIQDYGYGANGFDPLETMDHIFELKKKCDYVIVLYHAGIEEYRYITPYDQKCCRKMIEKGADLVVLQHTHCINCEEDYKGGKIVYGQGNFIFDHSKSEEWKTSLLVAVDFDDKGFKVSYIPIEKREEKVALSENEEILNGFNKRSEEIKDAKLVEDMYYDIGRARLFWCLDLYRGYDVSPLYRFITEKRHHKPAFKLMEGRARLAIINYMTNPAHVNLWVNTMQHYPEKEAEAKAKNKKKK